MSNDDTANVQPVFDAKEKSVACGDFFQLCDFIAANGQLYLDHVQEVHRLRDLRGNDRTYLHCPFKPCTVKTIAWSSLRGHMARHLRVHPSDNDTTTIDSEDSAVTGTDSVRRHADADGSGHHLASMDHTVNIVTPNYNQDSHHEMDAHAVYSVSDFGFSATSAFGVADAGSSH